VEVCLAAHRVGARDALPIEAHLGPLAIAVVVALVVRLPAGPLADADLADLAFLPVCLAGALDGAVAVAALLPGDARRLAGGPRAVAVAVAERLVLAGLAGQHHAVRLPRAP